MAKKLNGVPHNLAASFLSTVAYSNGAYQGQWLYFGAKRQGVNEVELDILNASIKPAELKIEAVSNWLKLASQKQLNSFLKNFITEAKIRVLFDFQKGSLTAFPSMKDKEGKEYIGKEVSESIYSQEFDPFEKRELSKFPQKRLNLFRLNSVGAAILISIALILYQYFLWDLTDLVTVFLIPLIGGLVYIIFGFAYISSIIKAIRNRKIKKSIYFVCVCIYTLGFILAVFVPWTNIWLKVNFATHLEVRQEVIKEIENGTLKNNVSYNTIRIDLPQQLSNASKGGYILEDKDSSGDTEVLFFTFAGVLDSYSGYLYTTSSEAPQNFMGDTLLNDNFIQDHWYFIASSN
jgi:hypothetical protein